MARQETVLHLGDTFDHARVIEARVADLTRGTGPEGGVGKLVFPAGNFPVSRPVVIPSNTLVEGEGIGVSRVLPVGGWGFTPLLPGFEDCTALVTAALHKVDLAGVMTYASQKYGYRTRGTSLGVFLSTPLDCGPAPGGWPSLTQLTLAFAFRREAASWTSAGLFGCSDSSNKTGPFTADASPYNCGILSVGGQLSVLVRLKDDQGQYHDFSFPLGGSPPALLRGIFQFNFVTGAVQAWYAQSATSWLQVAVSLTAADSVNFPSVGAWVPGRRLDHNFFATCQLGGAGPSATWGERYLPFDQTLTGFCVSGDLRFEDRGVGQQLRLLGQGTDVGASANPDSVVYDPASPAGASGFGLKLYLTDGWHAQSTEWWLVPWYGGASGMGYWLDTAKANDFTSSVSFRNLSLLGGNAVGGANAGGAGCHYKQMLGLDFDRVELGYAQHGIAKLGHEGTAYTVNLDHCRVNFTSAGGLVFGYGIAVVETTNVAHWGRSALASSGSIHWSGRSLFSDSAFAQHVGLFHGPGSQVCRLSGITADFEGGGPARGHFRFDATGAVEFDPQVLIQDCLGGTSLPGVPFITVTGPNTAPDPVFNRPCRLTVRDQVGGTLAVGSGPFVSVQGGRWTAPGNIAAVIGSTLAGPRRVVRSDSIHLVQDDDEPFEVQVLDAFGVGVDTSEWQMEFTLTPLGSVTPVFTGTTAGGRVFGATDGWTRFDVPSSVTQTLSGRYLYRLKRTDPGFEQQLASGQATVGPS